MQLLGPASLGVEMAEEDHHERGEAVVLLRGRGRAGPRLVEDRGGVALAARRRVAVAEAVVGQAGAEIVEVLVPPAQRVEKVLEAADVDVRGAAEAADPVVEGGSDR